MIGFEWKSVFIFAIHRISPQVDDIPYFENLRRFLKCRWKMADFKEIPFQIRKLKCVVGVIDDFDSCQVVIGCFIAAWAVDDDSNDMDTWFRFST